MESVSFVIIKTIAVDKGLKKSIHKGPKHIFMSKNINSITIIITLLDIEIIKTEKKIITVLEI